MSKNIIISLFDYTGVWSQPYRDNGYEVIQIDIQLGDDIMTWDYTEIDKSRVYGILAAVPCTDYAVSGARWFKEKDKDGRTEESQKIVAKTKEIIDYFEPEMWVIENPISRIHTLNPWLEKPKFYFHPHEFSGYGFDDERYTKKTALYGKFNAPEKKNLPPYTSGDNGKMQYPKDENGKHLGWGTIEAKNFRSKTPKGFSLAFFKANNNLLTDLEKYMLGE